MGPRMGNHQRALLLSLATVTCLLLLLETPSVHGADTEDVMVSGWWPWSHVTRPGSKCVGTIKCGRGQTPRCTAYGHRPCKWGTRVCRKWKWTCEPRPLPPSLAPAPRPSPPPGSKCTAAPAIKCQPGEKKVCGARITRRACPRVEGKSPGWCNKPSWAWSCQPSAPPPSSPPPSKCATAATIKCKAGEYKTCVGRKSCIPVQGEGRRCSKPTWGWRCMPPAPAIARPPPPPLTPGCKGSIQCKPGEEKECSGVQTLECRIPMGRRRGHRRCAINPIRWGWYCRPPPEVPACKGTVTCKRGEEKKCIGWASADCKPDPGDPKGTATICVGNPTQWVWQCHPAPVPSSTPLAPGPRCEGTIDCKAGEEKQCLYVKMEMCNTRGRNRRRRLEGTRTCYHGLQSVWKWGCTPASTKPVHSRTLLDTSSDLAVTDSSVSADQFMDEDAQDSVGQIQ